MLCDEPGALEHVLEVALREPLSLGDHAEAVRPRRFGARACSRICSGDIIACIGVSASAKRDCEQNPQSSAHPPDFALTSEHVRRVAEALEPYAPGALHERLDLGAILDLAERERAAGWRRHGGRDARGVPDGAARAARGFGGAGARGAGTRGERGAWTSDSRERASTRGMRDADPPSPLYTAADRPVSARPAPGCRESGPAQRPRQTGLRFSPKPARPHGSPRSESRTRAARSAPARPPAPTGG